MKNFKIKTVRLSRGADIKIRTKLYVAQLKKNITIFSVAKFTLPALMLGLFSFGSMQLLENEVNQTPVSITLSNSSNVLGELREIKAQKYKELAFTRASLSKAQSYKTRAHIRSVSVRKK